VQNRFKVTLPSKRDVRKKYKAQRSAAQNVYHVKVDDWGSFAMALRKAIYIRDTHLCVEDSMEQRFSHQVDMTDVFGQVFEDRSATRERPPFRTTPVEEKYKPRFYFIMPVLTLGSKCQEVQCVFPFSTTEERTEARQTAQTRITQYLSTRSDVLYDNTRTAFTAYCPDGSVAEFTVNGYQSIQAAYEAAVDHRLNFLPRFTAKADETLHLLFDDYAAQAQKLRVVEENTTLEQDDEDNIMGTACADLCFPSEPQDNCGQSPDLSEVEIQKRLRSAPAVDQDPDSDSHETLIGRCVCRKFGAAWYTGHVQAVLTPDNDPNAEPEFTISYCDREEERICESKLLPLLFDAELLVGRQVRISFEDGLARMGNVEHVVRDPTAPKRQLMYSVKFENDSTATLPQIAIVRSLVDTPAGLIPSADERLERAPDTHRLIGGHVRHRDGAKPVTGVIAWIEYLVYGGRKVPNAFVIYPKNASQFIPVSELLDGVYTVSHRGRPAAQDGASFAARHEGLHQSSHVNVAYDDQTDQFVCDVVFEGVRWLRREIPVLEDFPTAKFHANKLAETYAQEIKVLFTKRKGRTHGNTGSGITRQTNHGS
jgi:hypothetical protein